MEAVLDSLWMDETLDVDNLFPPLAAIPGFPRHRRHLLASRERAGEEAPSSHEGGGAPTAEPAPGEEGAQEQVASPWQATTIQASLTLPQDC